MPLLQTIFAVDSNPRSNNTQLTWGALATIDWRLRPAEVVFLLFALICTVLILLTPLPFSLKLAQIFVFQSCRLVLLLFPLSLLIIIPKAYTLAHREGWRSLGKSENIIPLLLPYWSLDFLLRSLRRTLAIFGTIYFFLHLKHVILFLHPANFDLFFWNLDRALHFGVQPNQYLLEAFATNDEVALLIDWLYIKYFDYKMIVATLFLMELKGKRLTDQFFCAYCMLWSIGGLSYLIMPTDGPCYALLKPHAVTAQEQGHIFPFPIIDPVPESYTAAYQRAKIWMAKNYHEILWGHRHRFLMQGITPNSFYGIAAVPSLHVAAVVMLMLFLFALHWGAGVVGALYATTIFFGSIFLQWHYATDGYIGALLGVLVIFISSHLFRKKV